MSNKNVKTIGVGLLVSALAAACGATADQSDKAEPIAQPEPLSAIAGVTLDGSLSASQKEFVRGDVKFMQDLPFAVGAGTYFAKAFKGTTASAVLNYMSERIQYFVAPNFNIQERVKILASTHNQSKDDEDNTPAQTIATNIGTALWLGSFSETRPIVFLSGGKMIPITNSRVGIIRFGESYFNFANSGKVLHVIARTSVLVHEARHSDCTKPLTENDKLLLGSTEGTDRVQDIKSRECGHLHTICPVGSDYAGLAACDATLWGAYSMGALYADGIVETCKTRTCNESALQVAMAVRTDSLSRLYPATRQKLEDGTLSDPDMSSVEASQK